MSLGGGLTALLDECPENGVVHIVNVCFIRGGSVSLYRSRIGTSSTDYLPVSKRNSRALRGRLDIILFGRRTRAGIARVCWGSTMTSGRRRTT